MPTYKVTITPGRYTTAEVENESGQCIHSLSALSTFTVGRSLGDFFRRQVSVINQGSPPRDQSAAERTDR